MHRLNCGVSNAESWRMQTLEHAYERRLALEARADSGGSKAPIKKKKKVLGITGQIMNETGKPIEIPLLKAILLGSKGENVKSWTFEAKQRRIDPGEKIKYETSLANPPSGSTGLQITFTPAEEEMMDDKMKAPDAK